MREKLQAVSDERACPFPACEHHYSVAEVATMWGLSPDAVRDLFEYEPGVLVLGNGTGKRGKVKKRRYRTLRIPEGVLVRVHRRLSNFAA